MPNGQMPQSTPNQPAQSKKIWVILAIIVVALLLLAAAFFLFRGKDATDEGNANSNAANSDSAQTETDQPTAGEADALAQYDQTTIQVTSQDNSLTGSIYLTVDGQYLQAVYNLKINQSLPTNEAENLEFGNTPSSYTLVGDLVEAADPGSSEGAVSAIYCNKEAEFADVTGMSGDPFFDCPPELTLAENRKATDIFVTSFSQSFSSYDELLAANQFVVYDAARFWEREDADTMGVNIDKAVQEGKELASYRLNFSAAR